MIDRVSAEYQALFRVLSTDDTTEKQAMAAAAIIEADRLANEWVFKGKASPLTETEMGTFLASKAAVSAGDRAYHFLCDWAVQNRNGLCGHSETIKVLGAMEPGRAYIIRSVFNEVISEEGFSTTAVLSYLKANGLIDTRGKNYTRGKRINGVLTECVSLKLEEISDDADEVREELPL